MIKNKNGITLIALVITIIILLILAGMSIAILTGEDGIINRAHIAKIENKRATIKEIIKLAETEEYLKNSQESDRKILEETRKNLENNKDLKAQGKEIIVDKEIRGEDEEIYFYVTVDGDNYKVTRNDVEYIGEKSKEEIELQQGEIEIKQTPTSWTNENVEIEIKVNTNKIQDYTIKYQINNEGSWIEYKDKFEVDKNCIINAKLIGINGESSVATGNVLIIDKLAPNSFTPTLTETTNSIKVEANTTDKAKTDDYGSSGISGYRFSKDNGKSWTEYQESGSYTFTGLSQNTDYTIKVEAKDKAENRTEGIASVKTKLATISLSSTSGKVVSGNSVNVTISGSNYGTLSCSSSNTSIATASISGTTLTITGRNTSGTQNATISVEGTEGGSATYTITSHVHSGSSSSGGGCYGTANTGYRNCGGSITAKNDTTTCGTYNLSSTTYKCSGCGAISSSSGTHTKTCTGTATISYSSTKVCLTCGSLGTNITCSHGNAYSISKNYSCSTCGASKSYSLDSGLVGSSAYPYKDQAGLTHNKINCGTYNVYSRTYVCSGCGTTSSSSGTHTKSYTYYTCDSCGTSYSATGTCNKSTSYTYYSRNCGY